MRTKANIYSASGAPKGEGTPDCSKLTCSKRSSWTKRSMRPVSHREWAHRYALEDQSFCTKRKFTGANGDVRSGCNWTILIRSINWCVLRWTNFTTWLRSINMPVKKHSSALGFFWRSITQLKNWMRLLQLLHRPAPGTTSACVLILLVSFDAKGGEHND